MSSETDLKHLLKHMSPVLDERVYAYALIQSGSDIRAISPVAVFWETESLSVIAERDVLMAQGYEISFPCRRISLMVFSSLEAVGLTAAVSTALAQADISANMVAAFHHDHVFVPDKDAERALNTLKALSETLP